MAKTSFSKMYPSRRTVKFLKILLLLVVVIVITVELHLRQRGLKGPAVYLRPTGGLGNQLFQYACAYSLAKRNDWPLYVNIPATIKENDYKYKYRPEDRDFTLHYFSIPFSPKYSDISDRTSSSSLLNERTAFRLDDFILLSGTHPKDRVLLIDEFTDCQSEYFFLEYKNEILKMFVQNINTLPIADWVDRISSKHPSSVAVHIRRGDLKVMRNRMIRISFYSEAMVRISKMLKRKVSFFVFSDDMDHVKDELRLDFDKKLGEEIASGAQNPLDLGGDLNFLSSPNTTSVEEFYLMSMCDHFIIPTSSFSWWAAYRNQNPDKIVIAAHYHPDFFQLPFAKLTWRHLYYPISWTTVEASHEDTGLPPSYFFTISFPDYILYFFVISSCCWLSFLWVKRSCY